MDLVEVNALVRGTKIQVGPKCKELAKIVKSWPREFGKMYNRWRMVRVREDKLDDFGYSIW